MHVYVIGYTCYILYYTFNSYNSLGQFVVSIVMIISLLPSGERSEANNRGLFEVPPYIYTSRSAHLRQAYLVWHILRQAVEHQLHMHMESPIELAVEKNPICLNGSLDYLPILVMPFKFVFLPVYTLGIIIIS